MCVILAIFILLLLAGYGVLHYYHGKSNYVKDGQVETADVNLIPKDEADAVTDSMTEDEQKQAEDEAKQAQDEIEAPKGKDVYNILLIGSDRRDSGWHGNSDVMMLATVNKNTKKIYLTSFMRDSYALVDGYGARKLNFAYAVGGGPKLVSTIEQNYRIDIDNYASADFNSTADIIDLIGGVTIKVSAGEAREINRTCIGPHEDLPGAGTYHLKGNQAVAYGRIRHVGHADYERTERQRRVMSEIFKKAKKLSLGQLNNLADKVLPLVTHNISEGDLISLLAEMPTVVGYDLELGRIPYDGMYSVKGEMLVPSWNSTIRKLHDTIYAGTK